MFRIALCCLATFLTCLSSAASDALYRALVATPTLQRLEADLRTLQSMGSRIRAAPTLKWAGNRLTAFGYSVRSEPLTATIPDPGAVAALSTSLGTWRLLPLWPNLIRTSTCDVRGPIVDGGDGSLEALRGKQVAGAIVVLDFDSQTAWKNAAALGAKAIIFRRTAPMRRTEAEAKFTATPLDVPRFLLLSAKMPAGQAHLTCRQDWISQPSANVVADLPGTDPHIGREQILLWGYADSMSVCPGAAPGAEQSTGVAALLELARLLAQGEHKRSIRIVISGAHCLALQGARDYVERRFERPEPPPLLVATLDLATSSKALGVFGRGYAYNYRDEILDSVLPLCRVLRKHAEQLTPLLGESAPRVVLTDAAGHSDNRTWKNNIPAKFAFDCEPFMSAGYNAVTFATIDDAREWLDTPDDTFDRVNVSNLLRQVQVLRVMLHHVVNDPVAQSGDDVLPLRPAAPARISHLGGFATADGYVAVYDPTKSLVPDVRVPDSLVVRMTGKRSLMGVRGNEVQVAAGPAASYHLVGLPPLTEYNTLFKPDTVIVAYHLDRVTGQIDEAPNEGAFGAEAFPTITSLKTSSRTSPIVLFRCQSTNLFGLTDPQDMTPFTASEVLDPIGGGPPRSYGLARSFYDETSASEADDTAVLFMPPDSRFQLLMGSGLGDSRLVLTGSTARDPAGKGYPSSTASVGDVAFATARDIQAVDASRIQEFSRFRIVAPSVLEMHRDIAASLTAAQLAAARADWPEWKREARAAWGLSLRVHPILQSTAGDVINGVLFYSFLLIPFSFFFERLVFAARSLARQVAITAGVFVAAFLVLRFVHPGFDLVSNPAMIFVGFVMGALSLIVATFILGKFESALREVKQTQSGIRELDVRRSNVAMAAFSLGISNLRRRKARTILTTATLVVMTFIVLSFTSVVPELQLHETPTSNPARYSGILLRNPSLDPLDPSAYDALRNEFSGKASVVRRVYSYGADYLPGAAMSVQKGDVWADASVAEGLDADEALLTHPQQALVAGRWFDNGERDTMIPPKPLAEALKANVGDTVRFMGQPFTVVGIFDPEAMKKVVDLDGEGIVPPDFNQSKQQQTLSRTQAQAFRKFIRLDPSMVFFLPAQAALDLGGQVRAVGVGFRDPDATAKAMSDLMPRLRLNLYAAVPTRAGLEVRQFSETQGSRTSGLGLILVQLGIAAIFVLNTMVASVYERTKEISIFSAIGLAPNHIAMLFFAESLVFGVLGVVFGYFVAQAVAKALVTTGALPQLTLNFSSTSAISSAVLVIGIVLLSTIYPARKAACIAAPAMAEEALESEPVGDTWTLPLPFSVSSSEAAPLIAFLADWLKGYEEYAIGSFVTSGTEHHELRVSANAWLAPYDLSVSQRLEIVAAPSAAPGVYEMSLTLERMGGEPKNWVRLNRRFLASIRRQFLSWRTLTDEERARFATLSSPA